MASQQKAGKGSSRKVGRSKRKALRRGGLTSLYVRGKITFEQYAKLTKRV